MKEDDYAWFRWFIGRYMTRPQFKREFAAQIAHHHRDEEADEYAECNCPAVEYPVDCGGELERLPSKFCLADFICYSEICKPVTSLFSHAKNVDSFFSENETANRGTVLR